MKSQFKDVLCLSEWMVWEGKALQWYLSLPEKVRCSHLAEHGERHRKQLKKEFPSTSDLGASQRGASGCLVRAGIFKVEAKQIVLNDTLST